jgi:thiosulfate reductase cytochrome b subunit
VLQKLTYAGVLFLLLPLMIATGLAMSPGANAMMPWLPEILADGRPRVRSTSWSCCFWSVLRHPLMIVAAGPLNELRSIITGWYRIDADRKEHRP